MVRRGVAALVPGLLLAASALGACSPRHSPPSNEPSPPAGSVSVSSPTASVGPTRTTPTATPTQLALGDETTVEWSPRAGLAGRITLRVTAIEQADWSYFVGWQVPQSTKSATQPYFIRATVANVGSTDLGGQPVPLYVEDAANQLVAASTFGSSSGGQSFAPCHPDRLRTPFRHGARISACLVMLVPQGKAVVGVTYRPHESDQPITWRGAVTRLPGHEQSS